MIYYHFTGSTLRDKSAIPPIGEWLELDGEPIPCKRGLHASPDAFDALQYALGNLLHRVELGGLIIEHGNPVDKYAAQKRKIIDSIDAEPIMRSFARRVALDMIDLWNAPAIVKEYLESGDESKRDAAGIAAWATLDATWDAAGEAARRAARNAAWAASGIAAWATAKVAAGDAAWATARIAQQKLYRGWFNEMVNAAFEMQEKSNEHFTG